MANGTDFILPEKRLETKVVETEFDLASSMTYYDTTLDVSLDNYIPISVGFVSYSNHTMCYQCRLTNAAKARISFASASPGDKIGPGKIGKISVVYLRK